MQVSLSQVARSAITLFGDGTAERFVDSEVDAEVDVLRAEDRPEAGLTCWATVGACRFDTEMVDADGRDWRIELLAVTDSDAAQFGAAMAECALSMLQPGPVMVGSVLPDVVARYVPATSTPHAFVVPPASWHEPPADVGAGDCVISFLQVVPIAESELAFLRAVDANALMNRLADAQVMVADLYRDAVL